MPRFNIKTARNEYDFRNTVFKRRNIRGKEGRAAIIKSKRLASLNESPNKEQTCGMARSQVKDGVIDDIFKINHGACIPQRKHPSKVKSNNEILATIRGIHQVDHNNQMLMQNKWTENLSPMKEVQSALVGPLIKLDKKAFMYKSNPDYGNFQSKQSTDISQSKDELKAENTLKINHIGDSNKSDTTRSAYGINQPNLCNKGTERKFRIKDLHIYNFSSKPMDTKVK